MIKNYAIILIMLISYNPITYDIHFCHYEDCQSIIINTIKQNKNIQNNNIQNNNIMGNANPKEKTVNCAFFDISDKKIISLLENISKRIIVDKRSHIQPKNARIINSKQLMHNKFCTIKPDIVITGSFNPTEKNDNYNNLIIIKNKDIYNAYNSYFNSVYFNKRFRKYNNNICFEPYEDCRTWIFNILNKQNKIYAMEFSFTDKAIATLLLLKNSSIIMEKSQAMQRYSIYNYYKTNNGNISYDNCSCFMHHKMFITDKGIITGSLNPTKNGYKNWENMIYIKDNKMKDKALKEFKTLGRSQ